MHLDWLYFRFLFFRGLVFLLAGWALYFAARDWSDEYEANKFGLSQIGFWNWFFRILNPFRRLRMSDWAPCPATVKHTAIFYRSRRGKIYWLFKPLMLGVASWVPQKRYYYVASYLYAANGALFWGKFESPLALENEAAAKATAEALVGKTIEVRFNPRDPADSVPASRKEIFLDNVLP